MRFCTSDEMKQDLGFVRFVDEVSPRHQGVQQVWLGELIAILQLLWEIWQMFKGKGVLTRWRTRYMTKWAMRKGTRAEQQVALEKIRDSFVTSA